MGRQLLIIVHFEAPDTILLGIKVLEKMERQDSVMDREEEGE